MVKRIVGWGFALAAICLAGVFVFSMLQVAAETAKRQQTVEILAELRQGSRDFDALRERNADTVGWLTVPGTEIDYPVVQSTDNDFYLRRDFDRELSDAGWIFADYRSTYNPMRENTVFYGHNMRDDRMFGTLDKVLTADWDDEQTIIFETPNDVSEWRVFSAYTIEVTNDYLAVAFNTREEQEAFATMLAQRSVRTFGTSPATGQEMLTLSTCGSETTRTVVHAVRVHSQ